MKKIVLVALLGLSSLSVSANYDLDMYEDQMMDQSISNETIDVDGSFAKKKKRLSPAERMRILRRKMEKKTVEKTKQSIEKMRFKQELMMMRKLQRVMNQQMKALDNL